MPVYTAAELMGAGKGEEAQPTGGKRLVPVSQLMGGNVQPQVEGDKAEYLLPSIPGYEREGFLENIKKPWQLPFREGIVPNIIKAYRQGTLAKDFDQLIVSGKDMLTKEALKEMWQGAKKDPGAFMANMVNAVFADPELALAGAGLGGATARALPGARTALKAGGAARTAAAGAVRLGEGAVVGGGLNAAISGAQQLADKGVIDTGELEQQFGVGAALGGPLNAAFGRFGRKTPNTRTPIPEEPAPKGPAADHPKYGARSLPEDHQFSAEYYGVGEDAFDNAAYQAYQLLARGATRSQAERAAKRNPLVGRILDDMATRRAQATQAMKDTLQGEVLPPEGPPRMPERPALPAPGQPALGQAGKADPELLARIAAGGGLAAVGATMTPEEPWKGALGGLGLSLSPKMAVAALNRMFETRAGSRESQIGAVKAPGGAWSQEPGERLSAALYNGFNADFYKHQVETPLEKMYPQANPVELEKLREEQATSRALSNWSDRSIKTYLQRYAGTERDPLKDIEVPYGEGTKRWEELTDDALFSEKAGPYGTPLGKGLNAKPGEDIWQLSKGNKSDHAIQSYLLHVGDYLRQNVPPEKLPQYDLTRAVKETAANDARVAKQMEKAAAAELGQLPVHKQYPDGYRWVELKAPEKLTPEQARGVRKATREEAEQIQHNDPDYVEGEWADAPPAYVAVDPSGKPVTNTYTGQLAGSFEGPEQAWLAGQLAREGNQMGHCVGGYCDEVASGQSKIYSLRDPKGKSHVTVEVKPRHKGFNNILNPDIAEKLGVEEVQNILQIKGKQNRAPNPEYLPYVQDFVKSGKWGEVRDLENARLYQRRLLPDDEKALIPPEQQYLTLDEIKKLREGRGWTPLDERPGWGDEQGFIDQDLLKSMGLIGGAAAGGALLAKIMEEDPKVGAALGVLLSSLGFRGGRQNIAKAVGVVSTRLREYSPRLTARLQQYGMNVSTRTHEEIAKGDTFLRRLKALDNVEGIEEVKNLIRTNAPGRTEAALRKFGDPELLNDWKRLQEGLQGLGREAQQQGRFKKLIPGYFPRIVKDVPGLLDKLEGAERDTIKKALDDADNKAKNARGSGLTALEQSEIINQRLFEFRRKRMQPGFAKKRGVEEITPELEPFYADLAESYHTYVRQVVEDLEKAKLFGKARADIHKNGQVYMDPAKSITNLIAEEAKTRNFTWDQERDIESLLRSVLVGPGKATFGLLQDAKNLSYAALLGSPSSAITQGAGLFNSWYAYGLRDSLEGLARKLSGKMELSAKDFGLADHLSEEFAGQRWSTRALNKVFKPLFQPMDFLDKDVMLNSALVHYRRLAKTPAGIERIRARYGEALGEDFGKLISSLQKPGITPETRLLGWMELSRFQPIGRMEVPQPYLDYPNGRLIYYLKTYMEKQADVFYNDGIKAIKEGRRAEGLYQIARFALALGMGGATMGAVKNFIEGKGFEIEGIDIVENFLKTFGLSRYVRDEVAKGRVGEAALSMVTPPFKIVDDFIQAKPKAAAYVPLVGKPVYDHLLGGKEAAAAKAEKEQRLEDTKELRELQRAMRLLRKEATE